MSAYQASQHGSPTPLSPDWHVPNSNQQQQQLSTGHPSSPTMMMQSGYPTSAGILNASPAYPSAGGAVQQAMTYTTTTISGGGSTSQNFPTSGLASTTIDPMTRTTTTTVEYHPHTEGHSATGSLDSTAYATSNVTNGQATLPYASTSTSAVEPSSYLTTSQLSGGGQAYGTITSGSGDNYTTAGVSHGSAPHGAINYGASTPYLEQPGTYSCATTGTGGGQQQVTTYGATSHYSTADAGSYSHSNSMGQPAPLIVHRSYSQVGYNNVETGSTMFPVTSTGSLSGLDYAIQHAINQGRIFSPIGGVYVPGSLALKSGMHTIYNSKVVPTFELPLSFQSRIVKQVVSRRVTDASRLTNKSNFVIATQKKRACC